MCRQQIATFLLHPVAMPLRHSSLILKAGRHQSGRVQPKTEMIDEGST